MIEGGSQEFWFEFSIHAIEAVLVLSILGTVLYLKRREKGRG